jgi:hypothetical protein
MAQADSTLAAIRKKVRRLTASASQSALSDADIDQHINTYYSQDFAYSVKIDQMRNVYTFFTQPYVDRYPLDVNYNQGVRAPCYFEGIQGNFMKDRQQFNAMWPRFPTQFQQSPTTLTGSITSASQALPCQITSAAHGLASGAVVTITGVVGMTELNGGTYIITVVDANNFSLTGIDSSGYVAYVSGGTWTATSQSFSFTIPGPFLAQEVVIGGVTSGGDSFAINDNGFGTLQLQVPNPQISVPVETSTEPGMKNLNTANPGQTNVRNIGSVDYVTGAIAFNLPAGYDVAAGTLLNIWVSQYQPGRPYTLFFWNNEFIVRPVPNNVFKVEVETFLTPVQLLESDQVPILNQWWQLIAIGAAIKILEERQDMEGVENLAKMYDRQEGLTLERQGVEEIFQPNITLFNSVSPAPYFNNFTGWY